MTDATIIIVASTISGSIAAIPAIITAWRVNLVDKKVDKTIAIVDGPLSLITRKYAEATDVIAKIRGLPDDHAEAVKAAAIQADRLAGKQETPQCSNFKPIS